MIAAVLLATGCERELLPVDPSLIVDGYEVRGTVADRFGNPIPLVNVSVVYTLEYVDDGPEPVRSYDVPSPGQTLTASVVNRSGTVVFVASLGTRPPGTFTYTWSGNDNFGNPASPGVYYVRLLVSGSPVVSFPVLISGSVAAVTDSLGRYVIRDGNLPVGFYPIPEYSSSGAIYYGNLRVTSEVILGFSIDGLYKSTNAFLHRNEAHLLDVRLD